MTFTDSFKRGGFYTASTIWMIGVAFFIFTGWWEMLGLAFVAFIQNMVFTWVSRSRNSGDPYYHFPIALLSNSIWFICSFIFILPKMIDIYVNNEGDITTAIVVFAVYNLSTAIGSTVMMIRLLNKETGKQRVGSR